MIAALICKSKAKSAFTAFNRRDIKAFTANWSDDAIFIYPGDLSVSGTYRGKQQFEKLFQDYLYQFPRFEFCIQHICVENLFDLLGSNVISVEWTITGKNKDKFKFINRGVTIIETGHMKATRIQDYYFDHTMLRKAWGEEP